MSYYPLPGNSVKQNDKIIMLQKVPQKECLQLRKNVGKDGNTVYYIMPSGLSACTDQSLHPCNAQDCNTLDTL